MIKRYIWVIGAGLVLALASFYLGQRYYAAKNHFLIRELQMNNAQKQKYMTLINNLWIKHEALCATMCARREELYSLLGATPIEKNKVSAKLEELARNQAEIEKETVDHICSVQEILTPQQRAKYLSVLNDKICQFNAESLGNTHYKEKAK